MNNKFYLILIILLFSNNVFSVTIEADNTVGYYIDENDTLTVIGPTQIGNDLNIVTIDIIEDIDITNNSFIFLISSFIVSVIIGFILFNFISDKI